MEAIKEFEVDTKACSQKEKAVLKKLISAAKLIAPLYLKQKNPKYPGANFYPPDATKEEIKEAAKKDPLILHPYTFVERDKGRKLKAIPFCNKFKKELTEVAKLLEEAARISEDRDFAQYLRDLAISLLKEGYAQNEILWTTRGPFKFNFIIGPIERYLDRLLFTKCAYQSWVGILDEKSTKEAERFKKIILASRRKIFPGTTKIEFAKLRIEINKTAIFSGLIADNMFTGTNLPNNANLMEKYGSKLTIFGSSLKLNFNEKNFPIFKNVFSKNLQKYFSKDKLQTALLHCILLHEISHSLIRYRDAEARLRELFPILDELLAYILGIKCCGPLLLKDALNQKDLEAIMTVFLSRNFRYWLASKRNPARIHYAIGGAIAMNFFLKEGAIKKKKRIYYPNFTKLFICIEELSHILEYYLALGNYNEAKEFVDEYGPFKVFESFGAKLKKIKEIKKS